MSLRTHHVLMSVATNSVSEKFYRCLTGRAQLIYNIVVANRLELQTAAGIHIFCTSWLLIGCITYFPKEYFVKPTGLLSVSR